MTLRVISPARAAVVAIFVALIATLLIVSNSAAAPVLTTDKEDYYSNETVPVTGSGFAPNTSYDIPIIRPDGSIVVGDGSFIPGWDSITSDGAGGFLYLYQLDGIFGTYEVRAYVSPWSGDLAEIPVASMEFTDADINFQQCQNDDNNDEVQDACVWTNGGLNQNNSLYTEGSAPPQRLFHRLDEIGAHVFNFEFEFSKSDSYAYDFITNADETLGALLNECANLPGFISSTECTDMFSTNVQFGDIPSDPFDGVGLRENPAGVAARQFRVGCTPACSVGVTVEFPDPPTGPTDGEDNPGGEAHTPDSDPDCFRNCGDSDVNITVTVTTLSTTTRVGMWFAGHLSETADPIGSAIGWGTGCNGGGDCGSSSISGAPFHFKYICLQEPSDTSCGSVGNRDNQIQSGGVAPPETFPFTVAKDFSDDSTAAVTVSLVCTSGSMTTDDATATEVPPDTADFTVSSPSGDPTCTATETPIPAGYTSTGTCSALLSVGTCTIVNTLNSAQFEVLKDFSDDNTADVTISVSCTSGSVTDDDTSASEADRANFTVTGFTYPGTTCTATESGVPFGYTTNDSDCQDGDAISPGGTTSCTMVNTVIPPTLTVNKVCDPPSDPGLFNLRIDASTEAADAACGGTTSAVTVSVGAHVVDETAGTGTSLGNYTTVISGDCNGAGDVTLAAGENKICTITNTLTTTTEPDVTITAQTPTGSRTV